MAGPSRAVLVPVLLLAALALAGCFGGDDPAPDSLDLAEDGDAIDTRTGPRPSVEGHVRDAAGGPLAGTLVEVQNENLTSTTNGTGYYSFDGLVDNQVYVLIAALDGYGRVAQQFVAIDDKVIQLDFTLEAIPEEEPFHEVLERSGLLSCQVRIIAGGDHGGTGQEVDQGCSGFAGEDPNAADTLAFAVAEGAVGLVIEVAWDSTQPLADFLEVTAETTGFGDLDSRLGSVIGPSPLKVEVAQDNVAKYYTEAGGGLRVIAAAHPEDDDEAAGGAAVAFQQPFTAYVSMFFVEPNPPTYTALEG